MKLVFAHDHIFQRDEQGNLYTGGSFNNQVWKRYLNHFSEITVLARVETLQDEYNNKTYNDFNLKETFLQPVPSLSGPLKQFTNRKEAVKIIQNTLKNSDALIARLPSEIGNLAIQIAKQMNKPYAVEVVACVWDALWNHGSLLGKVYAPIAMSKMKKNVRNAPYALYVTNEFLQNRYPSNGKTQNVSNVEIYDVCEESMQRRLNRAVNGPNKIGMIGSLKNKIKGWDVALRALSIMEKEGIGFEFYILGDGDKGPWLQLAKELGIEDRIIFCGVLPGGKPVLKWLDDIDIYIQPSFQEGLPRAVIEAMSRGCPVVGSTAGGIPELIDKSCLHKPGDYKNLAKILQRVMTDEEYAKELSIQNIEVAKKYRKEVLDKRRNKFWKNFIECLVL